MHAGGTLDTVAPSGEAPPTTYTYDPRHPVPTIGGSFSSSLKSGAYDQRERAFTSPSDVLVFQWTCTLRARASPLDST